MDDVLEIDLRKIINNLIRNWRWIAAITILAGLAGGLYSLLQPRVYEARAVVAISPPRYLPNFDSRYQTINPTTLSNKAILDIARSDEIQVGVFDEWQNPEKTPEDRRGFRSSALKATEGSDNTIINLAVRLDSSAEAARLANYWADLVVTRANQLYAGQDESQLLFFESQIETARQNLDAAESALADFEGRNNLEPLTNQYNELLLIQKEALRKQRLLGDAIRDAEGLLDQAAGLGRDQLVPAGLSLNLTLLQIRVYGDTTASDTRSSTGAGGTSPVQLQISDSVGNQPVTASDYRAAVQSWIQALEARSQELNEVQDQTTGAVFELQEKIQGLTNEKQRLELERTVARDTYTVMVHKYAETRITTDDASGTTKIASYSVAPLWPEARNTVRNTAIALVLGFMLSIAFVLVKDWWAVEEKAPLPVVQ
jgi:uncharacterized protein involved in exopolysaccharide biosynthesis